MATHKHNFILDLQTGEERCSVCQERPKYFCGDPTPWHQAVLMAVAITVLIAMVLYGR